MASMEDSSGKKRRHKATQEELDLRLEQRPERLRQLNQALTDYYKSLLPDYEGVKVTPNTLQDRYTLVKRNTIKL